MIRRLLLVMLLLVIAAPALAQEGLVSPGALTPASYRLDNITHIYQGWNNCGPATLTMALTYYGYRADQNPAAQC